MHKWTVKVKDAADGQTHEENVQAHWNPDHVLAAESVMAQGEFQVKKRNRFRTGAEAVPDSARLVVEVAA